MLTILLPDHFYSRLMSTGAQRILFGRSSRWVLPQKGLGTTDTSNRVAGSQARPPRDRIHQVEFLVVSRGPARPRGRALRPDARARSRRIPCDREALVTEGSPLALTTASCVSNISLREGARLYEIPPSRRDEDCCCRGLGRPTPGVGPAMMSCCRSQRGLE